MLTTGPVVSRFQPVVSPTLSTEQYAYRVADANCAVPYDPRVDAAQLQRAPYVRVHEPLGVVTVALPE
jgi:hypothetical protein